VDQPIVAAFRVSITVLPYGMRLCGIRIQRRQDSAVTPLLKFAEKRTLRRFRKGFP